MQPDPSAFREADILAVYGTQRICFQTAKRDGQDNQPVDAHHIMGRAGKKPESRAIHSSILNLAFIRRDIHTGPLRDDADQRQVYLKIAHRNVMNAVGWGHYELRDEDRAFMMAYFAAGEDVQEEA